MDNSYTLRLHCHNCGDIADYTIEKGMRVAMVPCENCGIKQLKRLEWMDSRKIESKVKEEIKEEMGLDD